MKNSVGLDLKRIDWQQVVMNGGHPCFSIEDMDDPKRTKFCLRAQRWVGHGGDHPYVSLEDLLDSVQEGSL